MRSPTFLEWFHNGAWHRIGWTAYTQRSVDDLRKHGALLAAAGGRYRLVRPSVYAADPPVVIHEYPVVAFDSAVEALAVAAGDHELRLMGGGSL